MKHIFLNLKRFDIPREYGGVNGVAPMEEWGSYIVQNIQKKLKAYGAEDVEFVIYFPEAHLIPAVKALCEDSPVKIGCQGVYRDDTAENGNFGAFTTNRTANAAKAMGCSSVIIGHCEERKDKAGILKEAGVTDEGAVGRLLNQEIKAAIKAGLTVLYCIGETDGEQEQRQEVLITIREGKFHQIKRMFEALGCRVEYLKRISMGPLMLDPELKPGEYRPLPPEEEYSIKDCGNRRNRV